MMFWSPVRMRFSCEASGEPMSRVRIWPTSTFWSRSIGSGSVMAIPLFTVRLYLPNRVTTPRSCGPTRWKQVKSNHSTTNTPRP
jgi:hypothetical protein